RTCLGLQGVASGTPAGSALFAIGAPAWLAGPSAGRARGSVVGAEGALRLASERLARSAGTRSAGRSAPGVVAPGGPRAVATLVAPAVAATVTRAIARGVPGAIARRVAGRATAVAV